MPASLVEQKPLLEVNREITSFVVDGEIYRVIGSDHGLQQLIKRRLDKYKIAGACLSLGRKLFLYNNSGKQIFIVDEARNLAVLVAIEFYKIVIITVINRSDIHVKENTEIETLQWLIA